MRCYPPPMFKRQGTAHAAPRIDSALL